MFINSFNKYVLCAYTLLVTTLGTENTVEKTLISPWNFSER